MNQNKGLLLIGVVVILLGSLLSCGSQTSSHTEPLSYQVTNTSARHDLGLGTGGCAGRADVTIQNTDSEAGTFTVDFKFWIPQTVYHDTRSVYILPGEWQTVEGIWQYLGCGGTFDWSYTVQPSMKTVP
jgi:hypothetical protein